MERPPANAGTLERALDLHRKALRLVPLRGKRPFLKNWQHLELGERDVRELFSRPEMNIGILTGSPLVVLDTDHPDADAWVQRHGITSSTVVRSGGGGKHYYFRTPEYEELHCRQNLHGIQGLDLKAWHGCIVAAGSIHPETGMTYEYELGKELGELHELPVIDLKLLKEERAISVQPWSKPNAGPLVPSGKIRNVHGYIRRLVSIQGQNGSGVAYRVAALLFEAGMSYPEALEEMLTWNETNAFPLWSQKEIRHKLNSVWNKKGGAMG